MDSKEERKKKLEERIRDDTPINLLRDLRHFIDTSLCSWMEPADAPGPDGEVVLYEFTRRIDAVLAKTQRT